MSTAADHWYAGEMAKIDQQYRRDVAAAERLGDEAKVTRARAAAKARVGRRVAALNREYGKRTGK